MFSVILDAVCEEGANVLTFCILYVFGKCFLVSLECRPVFWCVVCVRASVKSMFLAMLSAELPGEPGECVPICGRFLGYVLVHGCVDGVFEVVPVEGEGSCECVS